MTTCVPAGVGVRIHADTPSDAFRREAVSSVSDEPAKPFLRYIPDGFLGVHASKWMTRLMCSGALITLR